MNQQNAPISWPEMTRETGEIHPDNVLYKKEILAKYGEKALRQSWTKVCKALAVLTDEITKKETSIIQEIEYSDFFTLSQERKDELKKTGAFVIRNAIPEPTAKEWYRSLQEYVGENRGTITGWPEEQPYILKLFWSPTQLAARTHPNAMVLHRELNSFWHDAEDPAKSFAEPYAYADACRIRPPGPFYGLGPHIDGGSLCRWADPKYQDTYAKIWAGEPENWDPYDLTVRKDADQSFFKGQAQSRVLRTFQGWTALTKAAAREGTLLLYPNVQMAIAYVLLRPFFQPPDGSDSLDPDQWSFDVEDPWFPGVFRHTPQELSSAPFPHLRLDECFVHIPTMYPGDTIWWHCDMCHAVEVDHNGDDVSSVVYVASTPTTPNNTRYMKNQAQDFLKGVSPEDHRGGCHELSLKGFPGQSGILNGSDGFRAMGLTL